MTDKSIYRNVNDLTSRQVDDLTRRRVDRSTDSQVNGLTDRELNGKGLSIILHFIVSILRPMLVQYKRN